MMPGAQPVHEVEDAEIVLELDANLYEGAAVHVRGGPAVLEGQAGVVVREDGAFVVVRLTTRDDGGECTCDFRMPREMLSADDAPIEADVVLED